MSLSKLTFIGAGNMATSIIGGLIKQGVDPREITATDPSAERRSELAESLGIHVEADNQRAVQDANIVVLCVKPQVLQAVSEALAPALGHRPLVISIAAGIEIPTIESWLGKALPIVRCMPNTPALVLKGASGLFANDKVDAQQRQLVTELFAAIGLTEWVSDETLMHAVTALSGSGPAYVFYLIEAMEAAAVKQGLEAHTARKLAAQTVLGAAEMVLQSTLEPGQLKRNVMSPGGTTERAIEALEAGDLKGLFDGAIDAAARRSEELASMLKG